MTIPKALRAPEDTNAEAARSASPRYSEWQPIATAPKDGRVFLAYHGLIPHFVSWIDGEGWRVLMPPARGMGFGVHGNWAPFEPTHWMPLPDRPPSERPRAGQQDVSSGPTGQNLAKDPNALV